MKGVANLAEDRSRTIEMLRNAQLPRPRGSFLAVKRPKGEMEFLLVGKSALHLDKEFSGCIAVARGPQAPKVHLKDDLAELYLEGVQIRTLRPKIRLNESAFAQCDFRQVDLAGATLVQVEISHSDLGGALFNGAYFDRCLLNSCSLEDADFESASIRSSVFKKCRMQRVCLRSAKLRKTRLHRVSVDAADANGLQMFDCRAAGLRAQRANLQGCTIHGSDLSGARLFEARLKESTLRNSVFRNARLPKVYMRRAVVDGCDFQGGRLYRVTSQRATWVDSDLSECDLRWSLFTNSVLVNCDVAKAVFGETIFSNTSVAGLRNTGSSTHQSPSSFDRSSIAKSMPDAASFLIDGGVSIEDLSEGPKIVREIEFPPEYLSAGLHLLNHLPTWLSQVRPSSQPATVRIVQEGLRVRLELDTDDGSVEPLEEDLENFGRILTKRATPEDFVPSDSVAAQQFAWRLRSAESEVRQQHRMLGAGSAEGESLQSELVAVKAQRDVFRELLSAKIAQPIHVVTNTHVSVNGPSDVLGIVALLKENASRESELADEATWANSVLSRAVIDPERLNDAQVRSRLRRFFDELVDPNSELGKAASNLNLGSDLAAKALRAAEWISNLPIL